MTTPKNGASVHIRKARIADPESFREVFAKAVARFPNDAAAARAMECHRTLIVKLRGGRVGKWVKWTVVREIRKALLDDSAALERLDSALISESARAALDRYAEWNNSFFGAWTRMVNDVFAKVPIKAYESDLTGFTNRLIAKGFDPSRANLAILRALEPLALNSQSGGIELSIEELIETKKLRTYLSAAFKREEILLRRTPDRVRRAQEVTAPRTLGKGHKKGTVRR